MSALAELMAKVGALLDAVRDGDANDAGAALSDLRAAHASALAGAIAAERKARPDEMDARRYRANSVNEHRLVYDDEPHEFGAVHCQWYPDTPVGFCTLGGDSFDAMADAVVGHNTPEASRGE